MKKFILLASLSVFILTTGNAQELSREKSNHSFIEWNLGVAYIVDDFIFPGTSVLWGQEYISENNLIFEFELGVAFPTIVTGKIGVGKKFNNSQIVVGTRPWPFNLYIQPSFHHREKGYWIASLEYNPFPDKVIAFESRAILNFGYRWNLNRGERGR